MEERWVECKGAGVSSKRERKIEKGKTGRESEREEDTCHPEEAESVRDGVSLLLDFKKIEEERGGILDGFSGGGGANGF